MRYWYCYFLLFSITAFSQQKEGKELVDSLLIAIPKMKADTIKAHALSDLAYNYRNIDPEIGLKYGKEALSLSKTLKWNDGIALSYRAIGTNQSTNSEYEHAILSYETALKYTLNKKITSLILRGMGLVYIYQSNNTKALEINHRTLKMFEELKDSKGMAGVLLNIGVIYFNLKDYNKAIAYQKRSLAINQKIGNKTSSMGNYGNLANCYTNLKQFEKALDYYKKALEIADELGNKPSKALALDNMGQLYFELKQYEKALDFINASYAINEEIGNEDDLSTNLAIIGEIYIQKAKLEKGAATKNSYLQKAIANLNQSLLVKKKLGAKDAIAANYEQLALAQKLQGNYKAALTSYELYTLHKDSIYNAENKETIKNLEDQRTIDLKNKEIQLNKLTLESKEKQKWYFMFGILALGIIGSLLFYQSRNRKKVNEKLQLLNVELDQANKVKTRFFSILNHDLRSPVSNLIHFLHLQKDNPELLDEESKKRMENKTILGAENLLNSMEDILLWSKGQMENFAPKLKKITISSLFEDTRKHFSSEEKVTFTFENEQHLELYTDENYLKTIIRNLSGNAIKALSGFVPRNGEKPVIQWKAWRAHNQTFLSITDNGPGGTQEQFKALYDEKEVVGIQSGLGLHLIRDLAKAIDCNIEVDSKPNVGTTFILSFA